MWLDHSLTYSSALFTNENNIKTDDLYQAQQNKYQRILNEITQHYKSNTPQNILEIGCGWGGFAELAQSKYRHHIKGLSLSPAQLEIANQRLDKDINDSHHHLQDYRDENNIYDAIVSIEMFEAVGKEYWDSYFSTIKKTLKKQGVAVIQTILIADELFADYEKGTDFIQQYIFPGGMLPSNEKFHEYAQKAGLKIVNQHHFGLDYATTLKMWHEVFNQELEKVKKQGFDDVFIRMWQFYLAYCEAAFAEKNTDVAQYTLIHQE
jgi:cyclopropane-fatty-acyl-phospholipid synthase